MRFLFVAKQQRNASAFLDSLQSLVERGHDVTVAVQERDDARDRRLEEQVGSDRFRVVPCPAARSDEWGSVAPVVRRLRDCLHVLQPAFADAPALQARIFDKLRQELALEVGEAELRSALAAVRGPAAARLEAVLRLAEHSIPTSDLFDEFLESHRPDVVLVSPLVHFGSAQADVAASAKRLGLPVWMLLFSWDNLSTKGCMHVEPDLVFAWNERQRAEAVDLHRYPASRVVVVGAARFDGFFDLRPALTREQFHQPLGLDPSTPTLLYLCSSRLIAPQEIGFIRRWLAAVRASGAEALRAANVVIRPHPDVAHVADGVVFQPHHWSPLPELEAQIARPFDDRRTVVLRTSYKDSTGLYESLAHSTAVVGLNTTAELEAGIVGRPVFTLEPAAGDPDGPRATVHFHYLTREHGGFVAVASDLDEHVGQLAAALTEGVDPAPIRAFIESFLRPRGIERRVSPLLADALIEHAAGATATVPAAAAAATFDPRALGPGAGAVLPLSYSRARIVVHATPEALRSAEDGAVRLDRATVKWLEKWVKIGEVVYDLNAGIGPYVLLAARRRGAVVVAFEPGFRAYAALCDNVLLNECQGSVIAVPLALGSRDALAHIKYGRGLAGAEYHSLQWSKWRPRGADAVQPQVQPVCATRLDTALEQYGLPAPNHIRLAPAGPAMDVLQGAAGALASPSLRSVWLDVMPSEEDAVARRLESAGLHPAARRARRNAVQVVFSREAVADGTPAGRGWEAMPSR